MSANQILRAKIIARRERQKRQRAAAAGQTASPPSKLLQVSAGPASAMATPRSLQGSGVWSELQFSDCDDEEENVEPGQAGKSRRNSKLLQRGPDGRKASESGSIGHNPPQQTTGDGWWSATAQGLRMRRRKGRVQPQAEPGGGVSMAQRIILRRKPIINSMHQRNDMSVLDESEEEYFTDTAPSPKVERALVHPAPGGGKPPPPTSGSSRPRSVFSSTSSGSYLSAQSSVGGGSAKDSRRHAQGQQESRVQERSRIATVEKRREIVERSTKNETTERLRKTSDTNTKNESACDKGSRKERTRVVVSTGDCDEKDDVFVVTDDKQKRKTTVFLKQPSSSDKDSVHKKSRGSVSVINRSDSDSEDSDVFVNDFSDTHAGDVIREEGNTRTSKSNTVNKRSRHEQATIHQDVVSAKTHGNVVRRKTKNKVNEVHVSKTTVNEKHTIEEQICSDTDDEIKIIENNTSETIVNEKRTKKKGSRSKKELEPMCSDTDNEIKIIENNTKDVVVIDKSTNSQRQSSKKANDIEERQTNESRRRTRVEQKRAESSSSTDSDSDGSEARRGDINTKKVAVVVGSQAAKKTRNSTQYSKRTKDVKQSDSSEKVKKTNTSKHASRTDDEEASCTDIDENISIIRENTKDLITVDSETQQSKKPAPRKSDGGQKDSADKMKRAKSDEDSDSDSEISDSGIDFHQNDKASLHKVAALEAKSKSKIQSKHQQVNVANGDSKPSETGRKSKSNSSVDKDKKTNVPKKKGDAKRKDSEVAPKTVGAAGKDMPSSNGSSADSDSDGALEHESDLDISINRGTSLSPKTSVAPEQRSKKKPAEKSKRKEASAKTSGSFISESTATDTRAASLQPPNAPKEAQVKVRPSSGDHKHAQPDSKSGPAPPKEFLPESSNSKASTTKSNKDSALGLSFLDPDQELHQLTLQVAKKQQEKLKTPRQNPTIKDTTSGIGEPAGQDTEFPSEQHASSTSPRSDANKKDKMPLQKSKARGKHKDNEFYAKALDKRLTKNLDSILNNTKGAADSEKDSDLDDETLNELLHGDFNAQLDKFLHDVK